MELHEYVPQNILEIVKANRAHDRDQYGVLPTIIDYNHTRYYYAHYETTDRYLVVREDGEIPVFKEIEPVVDMAAFFVAVSYSFYDYGDQWVKEKTIQKYQRIQKVLDTLEKGLQQRLTEEQRDLLNDFRQTAQTVIDWQQKLEYTVAEGKKGVDKITYKVGSIQDHERLDQLQKQLLKCIDEQNQVQLDTYEKRKQLIKSLWKSIPLLNIRLWFAFYELRIHHQRMLNWSKMDQGEINSMEIVKRRIEGGMTPETYRELRAIKAVVINPR
ncbi:hypothetical protein ACFQ49_17850 [Kroppenstedtia eburnea]|uniref:hypothetical protein n=1 Tax=Kroppenstedtia eburnea TaxID=714067 RepID=UPI00363BBF50